MRWRLNLEEYKYNIEYTKREDNTAADALSRIHVLTRRSENLNIELDKKYHDWEKSTDALSKILKMTLNRKSFYQLSKTELGNYDRVKWLTKLNEIIHTNEKISIGDDSFTETEKNAIKRILLFLNNTVKELNFAWEPIQTYSDEEIDKLLKENHDFPITPRYTKDIRPHS